MPVILALILRLFAVFTQEESERLPRSDAANYDKIAMSVVSGEGFSAIIEMVEFTIHYHSLARRLSFLHPLY